jgi:hypothetical protein
LLVKGWFQSSEKKTAVYRPVKIVSLVPNEGVNRRKKILRGRAIIRGASEGSQKQQQSEALLCTQVLDDLEMQKYILTEDEDPVVSKILDQTPDRAAATPQCRNRICYQAAPSYLTGGARLTRLGKDS